jgi:hypothetical protein
MFLHSQRNLQAQLKTAQADTRPKFLIELANPTQEKLFLKISQPFKKIKNVTHNPTQTDKKTLGQ